MLKRPNMLIYEIDICPYCNNEIHNYEKYGEDCAEYVEVCPHCLERYLIDFMYAKRRYYKTIDGE
jgi:hypothetical protein